MKTIGSRRLDTLRNPLPHLAHPDVGGEEQEEGEGLGGILRLVGGDNTKIKCGKAKLELQIQNVKMQYL